MTSGFYWCGVSLVLRGINIHIYKHTHCCRLALSWLGHDRRDKHFVSFPSSLFPSPVGKVSSIYSFSSSGGHLSHCPSPPQLNLSSPPPSFFAALVFFFVPSAEYWQVWQRQSADAGLKSDRPCPAATQLGSRRSITPWHSQNSRERERASERTEGGEVGEVGMLEQEGRWKKNDLKNNNRGFCTAKLVAPK